MQTKLIGLFLFFTTFLQSCTTKYSDETISFQNYLGEVFHEKIPENKHVYLLIAQFRCAGCVEQSLGKIADKISKGLNSEVTIITYDNSIVPFALTRKVKVLLDKNAGYEAILSIANIALIKTENGKINAIEMINLDNSDKIIEEEF